VTAGCGCRARAAAPFKRITYREASTATASTARHARPARAGISPMFANERVPRVPGWSTAADREVPADPRRASSRARQIDKLEAFVKKELGGKGWRGCARGRRRASRSRSSSPCGARGDHAARTGRPGSVIFFQGRARARQRDPRAAARRLGSGSAASTAARTTLFVVDFPFRARREGRAHLRAQPPVRRSTGSSAARQHPGRARHTTTW
jgi:hypothetical protein